MSINNKAAKANKRFLVGIVILAVVMLFAVGALLVLSLKSKSGAEDIPEDYKYDIAFSSLVWGDSLDVAVNGTVVFSGTVQKGTASECYAPGNDTGNVISICDLKTGKTFNYNLPDEGSYVAVERDDSVVSIMTKSFHEL